MATLSELANSISLGKRFRHSDLPQGDCYVAPWGDGILYYDKKGEHFCDASFTVKDFRRTDWFIDLSIKNIHVGHKYKTRAGTLCKVVAIDREFHKPVIVRDCSQDDYWETDFKGRINDLYETENDLIEEVE